MRSKFFLSSFIPKEKKNMASKKSRTDVTTRPLAWQQLWLDRHREAMVRRLQDHVVAIADRLVQHGDIDPAMDEAYQFFVAVHTVPVEKARRFLDFLRTKPPETFDHFQSALRELSGDFDDLVATDGNVHELKAELDSLPTFQRLSLELCIPASVLEARKLLQSSYLKAAAEVNMLADVSRSSAESLRDLEDVFVNIGLVSSSEVEKLCSEWTGKDREVEAVLSRAMKAREMTLDGLFQAMRTGGKEPVRVMALGTAGAGKSFTFTIKAAYDWCGCNLWEMIALLRTIRCRDKSVWRAKTISELFQLRELGLSAAQEVQVEAFISQHPELVAVVCDGLDEGQVAEDSFLWRIMNGTSLRGLRVVITSRPCSAVSDLLEGDAIHRHVQLFGFSKENVREFVVKYLGKTQGEEMLSQLAEKPSVSSLMHTPFFALLLCEQFKDEQQLPPTRSGIFRSVVLRLVQRCARRQGLKAKFKTAEKAGTLYKHVLELGKVAFERLKRKDLSYFELEDEDLSPEAVGLGFLEHMQATSLSDEDQYGFRHLTMQEYLAAVYACAEVLKKAGDAVKLVEQLGCGEEAGYLNTFWVFVAGQLESDLREELFCAIAKTDIQTVARSMQGSRGDSDAPEPDNLTNADAHGELHGKTSGGENTEARVARQGSSTKKHERLGLYRLLLLLHCCQEAMANHRQTSSACVKFVLKKQGVNCRHYRHLSPSDLGLIFTLAGYYGDFVQKVDMDSCCLRDDGLQNILPGLLLFKSLKEIDLSYNYLSGKHMATVADVIARNGQSLKVIDLSYNNDVGDDGFKRLAEGLQQATQLTRLRLRSLGLTKASGQALASVVSHQPSLVEFDVMGSLNDRIEDSGFTAVAPALQKCQHLESLVLGGAGLTANPNTGCVSLLAAVLKSLPQLNYLNVGSNRLTVVGIQQLAPALQQCAMLRNLWLADCSLTSDGPGMALLTSVLLSLPNLEEFSVSANRHIGDVGFDQLSIGLEECPRLTHLDLWSIGITLSQSMSTISRLLRRLHCLKSLNFDFNDGGGSSIDMKLSAAVKGHPSLEELWLPIGVKQDAIGQLKSIQEDPTHSLKKLHYIQFL